MLDAYGSPKVLPSDVPTIARLFGIDVVDEVEFLGGTPNCTIRVKSGERQIAARVCNNFYTSTEHLECEVSLLRFLQSRHFPHTSCVVAGSNGSDIQYWQGCRVIATEFVVGQLGVALAPDEELSWQVGLAVGRLTRAMTGFQHDLPQSEHYLPRCERLIRHLPEGVARLGFSIDVQEVLKQWEMNSVVLHDAVTLHSPSVAHTDVWPLNVIQSDSGVIIIDFDDLAVAPVLLDLSTAVSEFALSDDAVISGMHGRAVLGGYISGGGIVTVSDTELIVAEIVVSYVSWIACNVVHQLPLSESVAYLRRLEALRKPSALARLSDQIARIFDLR